MCLFYGLESNSPDADKILYHSNRNCNMLIISKHNLVNINNVSSEKTVIVKRNDNQTTLLKSKIVYFIPLNNCINSHFLFVHIILLLLFQVMRLMTYHTHYQHVQYMQDIVITTLYINKKIACFQLCYH